MASTKAEQDVEMEGSGCIIYNTGKDRYEVYLVGMIDDLVNYLELMELLRKATDSTKVTINIHSRGGDLWAAMAIINSMRETKAHITTKILSMALSAAAFIFLAGHTRILSEFSVMLIHNYSGQVGGKNNEMRTRFTFDDTMSKSLYESVCKGFLTKDEIAGVLDGRDIWLDTESIKKRLK